MDKEKELLKAIGDIDEEVCDQHDDPVFVLSPNLHCVGKER